MIRLLPYLAAALFIASFPAGGWWGSALGLAGVACYVAYMWHRDRNGAAR